MMGTMVGPLPFLATKGLSAAATELRVGRVLETAEAPPDEGHPFAASKSGLPVNSRLRMRARLCLHDFRFQARDEGHDFTALRLRHAELVKAHSQTTHESRVIGLRNPHAFV
jgi:hypothetical protein